MNYYFTSFIRALRIASFLLSFTVAGFYLATVTTMHELLPTPLILSIAVARQGVPFPAVFECLLMLIVFDILREAGLRMPANIGSALSIVGALVIGQAAVQAKLVSAPVIIVIAMSGITGLMLPKLDAPIVYLRIGFIVLGSVLGLFGLMIGYMALLLYLIDLKSFGIYTFANRSLVIHQHADTFIRSPWWKMYRRPVNLAQDEVRLDAEKIGNMRKSDEEN